MQKLFVTLGFLLAATRAMAFGSCLDGEYLSRFDIFVDPADCVVIHEATITTSHGTTRLRAIRFASSGAGEDSFWTPYVDNLAGRLGPAIDSLGTARLPREISVFLTSDENVSGGVRTHGEQTDLRGGECQIVFYKLARDVPPDEFVFTMAHEIFHCAQAQTWFSAYNTLESDWWVEGSAEYFANLAMPGTDFSKDFVKAFDANSLTQAIPAMKYENVVLFAWLGNRGGPEGVGAFLSSMSAGDQTDVLRALIPEGDWITFIEAWLDGQVSLPRGAVITPGPLAIEERVFNRSGTLEVETEPYMIPRWGLTFPEKKMFDLTVTPGSGMPLLHMRELDSPGTWADPPAQINTCEDEQRHILYAASIDDPADATFTVETDEDDFGDARCCLIGDWKPTADALAGFSDFGMEVGAGPIAAQGGDLQCGYMDGDWTLSFRSDGSGDVTFNNTTNECQATMRGQRMNVLSSRNGTTSFDYTVVGEGAAQLTFTGHDVFWNMVMKLGPISQDISKPDSGPSLGYNGMAFTCAGDALSVQGIYGLSHKEADHIRITPPE